MFGAEMDESLVNSFEAFLKWGSTGLAGLMLVLVIFAILGRDVSKAKKSLLRTFMVIGAFCFVASLAAEVYLQSSANTGRHKVVLAVLPNDLDESTFPPPQIKVDGAPIDRTADLYIDKAAALTVDVSSALGLFKVTSARAEQARREVETTQEALASATEEAARIEQRATEAEKLVMTLAQENRAKTVALRETETALAQQDNVLRTVAAQSDTLARRIQSFSQTPRQSFDASRARVVPPSYILQLKRDIDRINKSLEQVNR